MAPRVRMRPSPSHPAPPLLAIVPLASEEQRQKQQEEESASLPEILARVPYKSLCRFKCVSQHCNALCSSRYIRKRSPQTLSGFFYLNQSGRHFQTGQWTYMKSKWASGTPVDHSRRTRVFLNGTLHLTTLNQSIVTVDTTGKVWREIQMPEDSDDIVSIGQSQGRLYAWQIDNPYDCRLCIWVLEDYGTGKWTLKHTVNVLELFGRDCRKDDYSYLMFAIHPDFHPDFNVIFLNSGKKTVSYNLDTRKVDVIFRLSELMYGLPYVPCLVELPSAGH
ncbi:unnamed protein product [Alopecurus aequalis]